MDTNALNRAGDLLNANDYADLKTQVRRQGEALKLMHQALQEVARELKRLDGRGASGLPRPLLTCGSPLISTV
jgi:hypothetical protein